LGERIGREVAFQDMGLRPQPDQQVIMPLCQETDTSRRPRIGWPQRGYVVRRPRLTSGSWEPPRRCQSTFRPASVRETLNAEARGCVRRRRTPRVEGLW
jgi:hypothetical protein